MSVRSEIAEKRRRMKMMWKAGKPETLERRVHQEAAAVAAAVCDIRIVFCPRIFDGIFLIYEKTHTYMKPRKRVYMNRRGCVSPPICRYNIYIASQLVSLV